MAVSPGMDGQDGWVSDRLAAIVAQQVAYRAAAGSAYLLDTAAAERVGWQPAAADTDAGKYHGTTVLTYYCTYNTRGTQVSAYIGTNPIPTYLGK